MRENAILDKLELGIDNLQAQINTVHAFHSMALYRHDWLVENADLRQKLVETGVSFHRETMSGKVEGSLRLPIYQALEQIMDIVIIYLKNTPSDLDFLFSFVELITSEQMRRLSSFRNFLYKEVIASESVEYQRSIVDRCIELYSLKQTKNKMKAFIFRDIANPILAMDSMRGIKDPDSARVLDKGLLDTIQTKLWKPYDSKEEESSPGTDHARLELMQMSTLLLKYHPDLISDTRKDLIKFAWSYNRMEDTINKHASYVLVAYFVATFESPQKIVSQIYVALLQAHTSEGRTLVWQALDLLAPVLPKRLQVPAVKGQEPQWARWPKKIISEGRIEPATAHQHIPFHNPAS